VDCVVKTLFFTKSPVTNFASAKTSDLAAFSTYFNAMLNMGIYLAPSQYESLFFSYVLPDSSIELIGGASEVALMEVASKHSHLVAS
jgi:glutamate-1-semialdehyde 2,1-aminomutase